LPSTTISEFVLLPKIEAVNFPHFPHFPQNHRARIAPLFIPDLIADGCGARPFNHPQYPVEDGRIARMAREGSLERVALDLRQAVIIGAAGQLVAPDAMTTDFILDGNHHIEPTNFRFSSPGGAGPELIYDLGFVPGY
jgi:hypothetical protein